jgi:hypothetical protein
MLKLGDTRLSSTNLKVVDKKVLTPIDSAVPLDIADLKENQNLKSKQTIESVALKGQPNILFFLEP